MKVKKGSLSQFDLNNQVKPQAPLYKDQPTPDLKKLRKEVAELQEKTFTQGKGRKVYG